ncbi:MAG TPA: hypothetical protein DF613_17460 [Lachnospiraceae bacterium]|nr:hypothetical protein [Lachnospiraceae bacterium]
MLFFIRQCVTTGITYLLTTLLCGTAAWIIWAAARRLLQGRGMEIVSRSAGRLAEWLYVLPVVHIGWEVYIMTATEFELFFGRVTQTVEKALLALAVIWVIGFLWTAAKRLSGFCRQRRRCGACIPCTGERAELFRRACWRSGIAGEILPYQGDQITEPFVRGVFTRRMYLPAGEISQEEMQELLRKCRWSERCMAAVELYAGLVHWYNPLVTILRRRMAEDTGAKGQRKGAGGISGRVCILLVLALQLAFTGFCALKFLEGYTWLDTRTSDVVEMEGEESDPPKEYVTTEKEAGIVTEDDTVEIDDQEGSYEAYWYVYPQTRNLSPAIYGEAGQEVSVLVMGTDGIPFKCGIQYEDGTRQYAMGDTGGLCTFFKLRQTGYFRFFAQNDGDEKMEFTAMFHVVTE